MPKGIPNVRNVYIVSEQSVKNLLGSVQEFLDSAQTLPIGGGEVSAKPIQRRRRRTVEPTQEEKPTIQMPRVD